MAGVSSAGPGAIRVAAGELELNAGRAVAELHFSNTADRPIQIGSHIHLPDVNAGLAFDREVARGCRLDIPAGTSVRFEPGVSRTVGIVRLAGAGLVPGLQLRDPEVDEGEATMPDPFSSGEGDA